MRISAAQDRAPRGAVRLLIALLSACGVDSNTAHPTGGAGGEPTAGGAASVSAGAAGSAGSAGAAGALDPNAAGSAGIAGGASGAGGSGASGGSMSGAGGVGGSAGLGGTVGSGGGGGLGGSGGTGGTPVQSAGCGKPRTLMDGRIALRSADLDRSFILRVPEDYDPDRPYRLVLAYHWLGGTAEMVVSGDANGGAFYGLWDLAAGSTVFVAPEGIDEGWGNADGRDVAFTDAILEQVESELCIDTERIFATGFSFGGAMSYALACARADVFRAVAIYSGAQLSGCDGGTDPIAYFATRGVQEAVIDPVTTGRALRDRIAAVNGCTPETPPEPASGSGTHLCTSYDGCMEGYPVRWCAFDGGHTASPRDQGQATSWVPQQAWEFLTQF